MLGFGDRKTLNQALTDDDIPTSGFLFAEISKITHKSVSDCQALEDYLLNQLDKGSLKIKLKVLKILMHLVKDGHHQFRADLKTRMDGVRNALQIRGPPDPLRGDAYYRDIKAIAQEVMNSVYDTDSRPQLAPQPISSYQPSQEQRQPMPSMGSMGSMGSQGSGMGGDIASRSMSSVGAQQKKEINIFGLKIPVPELPSVLTGDSKKTSSPAMYQREQEKARSTMSNMPGSTPSWAAGGESDWAESGSRTSGQPGGSWGGQSYSAPSSQPQSQSTHQQSASVGQGGYESRLASQSSGGYTQQQQTSEPAPTRWPGAPTSLPVSKSSGELERTLVEDVCQPGGVRVAPPPSKLLEFVQRAQSLDNNILGGQILDKLQSDEVQVIVKALYVVEAVLKQKSGALPLRDIFVNELETFRDYSQSENQSIAGQAAKCVKLIEGGGSNTPKSGKGPAPRAVAMDNDMFSTADSTPASNGGGMFDGMSFGDSTQQQTHQQPSFVDTTGTADMFGDMTIAPVHTTSSTSEDFLSQLDPLKNPSTMKPQSNSSPHQQQHHPQQPFYPQQGYQQQYPMGYPGGAMPYPQQYPQPGVVYMQPGYAYPPQMPYPQQTGYRPRIASVESPTPGSLAAGGKASLPQTTSSPSTKGGFDFVSKPKDQFEDLVASELKHN